jgi:two-component system nitrate/nitrite response regulator NarL
MLQEVSVWIVEPVALFREGLRLLLQRAEVKVGWCDDVPPDPTRRPDPADATTILVTGGGLAQARQHIAAVRRTAPDMRVVLLVDTSQSVLLAEAMQCGADTVVPRNCSINSLIYTLRLVQEGAAVFPRDVVRDLGATTAPRPAPADMSLPAMVEHDPTPFPPGVGLSERETMVLMWLRDGLPNKEIARRMGITEATVKVHVKAILRKARMRNRTQVACWASRQPSFDRMVTGPGPVASLRLDAAS